MCHGTGALSRVGVPKYTVQLTDADLGIETPQGILFLQLLEAEHVPRMDLLSKSDPYCK